MQHQSPSEVSRMGNAQTANDISGIAENSIHSTTTMSGNISQQSGSSSNSSQRKQHTQRSSKSDSGLKSPTTARHNSASRGSNDNLHINSKMDSPRTASRQSSISMQKSQSDIQIFSNCDSIVQSYSHLFNESEKSYGLHYGDGPVFTSNDESLSESYSAQSDKGSSHVLKAKLKTNITNKRNERGEKSTKLSQIISGVTYKSKAELFKRLFKDMPGDEQLVVDYSCALHRDILVHGRLYLSQNWFCFYANIIGWETLVTIQWTEITAITKEKTARVIPNAIQMCTPTEKFFFTTFVTREHAYTALFRIWQNALLGQPLAAPELKALCRKYRQRKAASSKNNGDHDETGDEALEDTDPSQVTSEGGSLQAPSDLSFLHKSDENTNDSSSQSTHQQPYRSSIHSTSQSDNKASVSRRATRSSKSTGDMEAVRQQAAVATKNSTKSMKSNNNATEGDHGGKQAKDEADGVADNGSTLEGGKDGERPSSPLNLKLEPGQNVLREVKRKKKKKLRGPIRQSSYHLNVIEDLQVEGESTDIGEEGSDESEDARNFEETILCLCHDSHPGTEYSNEEFNFDVDALFEHLFYQESDFMKRVYEERKRENWRYTPLERNADGSSTQVLKYTLHLDYSIGPKTAATTCTQVFEAGNIPGGFYTINVETSSSVPYGDSFHVFTRYCITRAPGNRSRLKVHAGVTFTKKVFGLVKNMITKNTDEALRDEFDFLATTLRSESDLLHCAPVPVKTKKKKHQKQLSEPHHAPLVKKVSLNDHHRRGSGSAGKKADFKRERKSSTPRPEGTVRSTKAPQENAVPLSSTGFQIFVAILFFLLLLNVYLFNRLRTLEKSLATQNSFNTDKDMPTSNEEWIHFAQRQKHLHMDEISKLKSVVGDTASIVKHVQESIGTLYHELDRSTLDRGMGYQQQATIAGTDGKAADTSKTDTSGQTSGETTNLHLQDAHRQEL